MIFPGETAAKVAIVTGAARGLGLSTARKLAADGASVVIADVREPDPDVVTSVDSRLRFMQCDVSISQEVDRLVDTVLDQAGRLDIMVANAGIGGGGPVVELTDDVFRTILAVNLEGAFYCCRAAARVMIPNRCGVIITVGSIFGRDTPARSSAYGASKAGVMALTASLARELGPHGIRVNCVSPGNMATEMHWTVLQNRAAREGVPLETVVQHIRADIPLGRHGDGDDVAALVSFLVSPQAAYITGQTINVDGGYQPR